MLILLFIIEYTECAGSENERTHCLLCYSVKLFCFRVLHTKEFYVIRVTSLVHFINVKSFVHKVIITGSNKMPFVFAVKAFCLNYLKINHRQ